MCYFWKHGTQCLLSHLHHSIQGLASILPVQPHLNLQNFEKKLFEMSADETMEDPFADLEASINGLVTDDPIVSVMAQLSKKILSLSMAQSSILLQ